MTGTPQMGLAEIRGECIPGGRNGVCKASVTFKAQHRDHGGRQACGGGEEGETCGAPGVRVPQDRGFPSKRGVWDEQGRDLIRL